MAYITRVAIEEFRNVRGLDIDLRPAGGDPKSPSPFRHLILTGSNGSGKSSALFAIVSELAQQVATGQSRQAVLATYSSSLEFTRRQPPTPGAMQSIRGFEQAIAQVASSRPASVKWTTDDATLQGLFAGGELLTTFLPAVREGRLSASRGPQPLSFAPAQLAATTRVSQQFLQYMVNRWADRAFAREEHREEEANRLQRWFSDLEQRLREIVGDPGAELVFERGRYDFDIRRSDGFTFSIQNLADGHAALIAIVAELLIRVEEARRIRNDVSYEPEGVAVIDEIETHLHLKLQEDVLPFLTAMFPKIQFLVATHSPAVISSIPNAIVYDMEKRVAERSEDFRGIRYGTLMTHHFGLPEDVDLDSTVKLQRLRELSEKPARSGEEEAELQNVAAALTRRSTEMGLEVWRALKRDVA